MNTEERMNHLLDRFKLNVNEYKSTVIELMKAAYNNGHYQGWTEGFEKGCNVGYQDGYDEGLTAGRSEE